MWGVADTDDDLLIHRINKKAKPNASVVFLLVSFSGHTLRCWFHFSRTRVSEIKGSEVHIVVVSQAMLMIYSSITIFGNT